MLKKITAYIQDRKHWLIWGPLILLTPDILGKITQALDGGKPLPDDVNVIYGYSLVMIPIILAAISTATIVANDLIVNNLTREEYAAADWKSKLVDSANSLIIFLAILLYLHSRG